VVRAGVGVDAGAVVSDTVNVDTLVETVRDEVAHLEGCHCRVCAALSDLAARARLLDQVEAIMTAEEPEDHVFRFFQRLHGLPETGAPKHPAEAEADRLARRVAELEQEREAFLAWKAELAGDGGGA
jgi:hypothetical protein